MERDESIEQMIRACVTDAEREPAQWAIAYGLCRIARETERTAYALRCLGNADALTQMGAIEGLAVKVGEVASGVEALADAVRGLDP